MKLVNLLASIMLAGGIAAPVVHQPEPVVTRPLAEVIQIDGADAAYIRPGPVQVVRGEDINYTWMAHADAEGRITFRVKPGVDYTITARVGPWHSGVETSHPLPVTRDHRIEQAVRDLVDANRRLQAEGANFFDIARWQSVIVAEDAD